MARKNAQEIVATEWQLDDTVQWHINLGVAVDTARSARRIANALEGLNTLLRSIGDDGIHYVVRAAAKRERKKISLARAKASAKRRDTLAAKRVA